MTELRMVLANTDVQAQIKDGKRRLQEHRNAAGKNKTPSLVEGWNAEHQAIIEGYLSEVIAIADKALAGYPIKMTRDEAWKTFWQTEDRKGNLTKIGDRSKRQFQELIDESYLEESAHGGPLSFLFDMVCTKAVAAVFKLRFGS